MSSDADATAPRALPSDQDASGRTFDEAEIALVTDVLRSGTLTATKGTATRRFEARFAELTGAAHVHACASGSAAVHCAVAAVDPAPGDEVVTTSITDMGAITPILYQGAIPVFADVDPTTGNVTAETLEARISERTRALVVTHLFGHPVDMDPVLALAARHGLAVIEDAAQAPLATDRGRTVGTIGTLGCFSFQQGKHVTTGEGGLVTTNDARLARTVKVFIDKAWPYGEAGPDHEFLALNYRLTELQGAVGLAQLDKLAASVATRRANAQDLTERLAAAGLPGVGLPGDPEHGTHAYWRYCLSIDPEVVPGGNVAVGAALKERGIATAPRYISKPAFACKVIRDRVTFGGSGWPWTQARPEALDHSPERFAGTYRFLDTVLVLPWNERYGAQDVDHIATATVEAVEKLLASA